MAGKLVALILMAVVAVNAKALDGAKTHTSKPKKDKAPPAPAAAAPSGSAGGGSPPATAARCARATVTTPLNGLPTLLVPPPCRSTKKSLPYTFTASMSEDQKKVFKEVCAGRRSLTAPAPAPFPGVTPVRLASTADA